MIGASISSLKKHWRLKERGIEQLRHVCLLKDILHCMCNVTDGALPPVAVGHKHLSQVGKLAYVIQVHLLQRDR